MRKYLTFFVVFVALTVGLISVFNAVTAMGFHHDLPFVNGGGGGGGITPAPTQTPTPDNGGGWGNGCSCTNWSSWEDVTCGGGNCPSDKMQQRKTRTCTPSYCLPHDDSKCVNNSTCSGQGPWPWSTCSCGDWSDYVEAGCGKGDDCSIYQSLLRATRTCNPAGCKTEEDFQCGACSTTCHGNMDCNGYMAGQQGNCLEGYTCGSNCQCVPRFYSLSVSANISGPNVSGGGMFAYESNVTVSADATYSAGGINYKFSEWSGYCGGNDPVFSFSMPKQNITCTANYEKEKLGTLSISYSGTFVDQLGTPLNFGNKGPKFSLTYYKSLPVYPFQEGRGGAGGIIPPGGYSVAIPVGYQVRVSVGGDFSVWPPSPYLCKFISASCPSGTFTMTEAGAACTAVYGNCEYCCSGPGCPPPPTPGLRVSCLVSYDSSPAPAKIGETVTFTASASGGSSYTYSWTGGCVGGGVSCQNSFSEEGSHIAQVTVTSGNEKKTATCSVTVEEETPNLSVSCVAAPDPAKINQEVTFTATPGGGTGTYAYTWSGFCQGNQKSYKTSFSSAGTYGCTIEVISGTQKEIANCSVTVQEDDPPLSVTCTTGPNPAEINQEVTFMATPGGGTGTYAYTWSGACTGTARQCKRSFSSAGTHTAQVTVSSGDQTAPASCSVTVCGCTDWEWEKLGCQKDLGIGYGCGEEQMVWKKTRTCSQPECPTQEFVCADDTECKKGEIDTTPAF